MERQEVNYVDDTGLKICLAAESEEYRKWSFESFVNRFCDFYVNSYNMLVIDYIDKAIQKGKLQDVINRHGGRTKEVTFKEIYAEAQKLYYTDILVENIPAILNNIVITEIEQHPEYKKIGENNLNNIVSELLTKAEENPLCTVPYDILYALKNKVNKKALEMFFE